MGRNIISGSTAQDQTTTNGARLDRRRPRPPGRLRDRRPLFAIGIGLAAALSASGCASGNDDSASETAATVSEQDGARLGDTSAPDPAGDAASPDAAQSAEAPAAQTGGAPAADLPLGDFGRDIIRNAGVTMSTSDVAATTDAIREIVAANGGAVFGSDIAIGEVRDDQSVPGGGTIVVRIPPADLDRLVGELDRAGVVSRLTQDSQDVTDQLVDLGIRIRQAETGIERIEALLEQTGALDDVFEIETELTNRQVELERLRAAQRNTDDLVALATLTITVEYREPAALEQIDEPNDGVGDAFADGWSAFVGAVFAVGLVLAVSAPFLLTAFVVAALAWTIGRRWTRHQARVREEQRIAADRRGVASGLESPKSDDDAGSPVAVGAVTGDDDPSNPAR